MFFPVCLKDGRTFLLNASQVLYYSFGDDGECPVAHLVGGEVLELDPEHETVGKLLNKMAS